MKGPAMTLALSSKSKSGVTYDTASSIAVGDSGHLCGD
jgi:hypothetical protein